MITSVTKQTQTIDLTDDWTSLKNPANLEIYRCHYYIGKGIQKREFVRDNSDDNGGSNKFDFRHLV